MPEPKTQYDVDAGELNMVKWLLDYDLDEENEVGDTSTVVSGDFEMVQLIMLQCNAQCKQCRIGCAQLVMDARVTGSTRFKVA